VPPAQENALIKPALTVLRIKYVHNLSKIGLLNLEGRKGEKRMETRLTAQEEEERKRQIAMLLDAFPAAKLARGIFDEELDPALANHTWVTEEKHRN
jgi:hypothetical protein